MVSLNLARIVPWALMASLIRSTNDIGISLVTWLLNSYKDAFLIVWFLDGAMNILLLSFLSEESVCGFSLSASLYNTSYKIGSKIITNRLKPVLDSFLSPFQSSFLTGRNISNYAVMT
ncbi:hypothetical protein Ancab_040440 [Ancistrocladus abbreviatus]